MSRVLLDTNVIVSALIFPHSAPARALAVVIDTEQLVLTEWILGELRDVVGRKWPDRLSALDGFLSSTGYELLGVGSPGVEIRDVDDQPILDAAISGGVDVIVTGDKDFLALTIGKPRIVTVRSYLDSRADR